MMKLLIVEDKEYIRKALINLLGIIEADVEVIGECESVQEAVIVSKACKPELVFLDINLKDGNAFEFLDQTTDLEFKVIFITAYEEYALKALKHGAVDYLLKPVDVDELQSALDKVKIKSVKEQQVQISKAKDVYQSPNNKLILSLQDSLQVINLSELMYCESDKGYTTFYCLDGKKHMASKTLKEFEEQLLSNNFVRPHQSYIVNLEFIDKYDKSGIIYLKDGSNIPVSFRKKEHFLEVFLEWNNN